MVDIKKDGDDSNSPDKRFYSELLHVIGLSETKQKGGLIERKKEGQQDPGSLLENTINQLDSLDKINRMKNAELFGATSFPVIKLTFAVTIVALPPNEGGVCLRLTKWG